MNFNEIYSYCGTLGKLQDGNLPTSLIKLGEETGELNEAYLRSIEYKSSEGTDPVMDMKKECADGIIMLLDIAQKLEMSENELYELLEEKLEKWRVKYSLV
jgi:NTP pyrophosphatase (non-canonical NTP hydrolase)